MKNSPITKLLLILAIVTLGIIALTSMPIIVDQASSTSNLSINSLTSYLNRTPNSMENMKISLSPEKDLSELNFTKPVLNTAHPLNIIEIHFSLNASKCRIHPIKGDYVIVKIDDLKLDMKPGEPQLPIKTYTLRLPKNARIIDVRAIKGSYREIQEKLLIAPVPIPPTWTKEGEGNKLPELNPNKEVYEVDTLFPGKFIDYTIGSDGEDKILLIKIYPVQYIPKEQRVIIITDSIIKIYYHNLTFR